MQGLAVRQSDAELRRPAQTSSSVKAASSISTANSRKKKAQINRRPTGTPRRRCHVTPLFTDRRSGSPRGNAPPETLVV